MGFCETFAGLKEFEETAIEKGSEMALLEVFCETTLVWNANGSCAFRGSGLETGMTKGSELAAGMENMSWVVGALDAGTEKGLEFAEVNITKGSGFVDTAESVIEKGSVREVSPSALLKGSTALLKGSGEFGGLLKGSNSDLESCASSAPIASISGKRFPRASFVCGTLLKFLVLLGDVVSSNESFTGSGAASPKLKKSWTKFES